MRGTILLSKEGINLFLAGARENVDSFLSALRSQPEFADLNVKESISDHQPFSRMLVRLKKEIISMGVEAIQPQLRTSPKISALELKQWLDEGRDLTLLDVRNDYEIEIGTFKNAVPIGIDHFRKFPEATAQLPDELRQKPVVMFCTGGIRCEKAGPLMEQQGFNEIYQLDGGILKYFEDCGGAHYQGDCFVFDKRVAVDPALQETDLQQCFACQAILSVDVQQSPDYLPPRQCPYCVKTPEQELKDRLEERTQLLRRLTDPLPGSISYENVRPMNVPLRFDNCSLLDFLCGMHANLNQDFWLKECSDLRVTYKDEVLSADAIVRAGWRVHHHIPQTIEPEVSNDVRFLFEDDAIIAIDKPAPLPMHACGRFNRNTLQHFLKLAYPTEQIRILHRLDAETKGVVILARYKTAAAFVQKQFHEGKVQKTYLARVIGNPATETFFCDAPIGAEPIAGGARRIEEDGLPSKTEFSVARRFDDGTTLLKCFPKTGRTNQIRLHLQTLGMPILGDRDYQVAGLSERFDSQWGLCLQAFQISFVHPVKREWLTIESKVPCPFVQ